LDLTEDFAAEQGLGIDRDGFEASMNEQRERARAARNDSSSMKVQGGAMSTFEGASEFVGYSNLVVDAKVIAIVVENELADSASAGETVQVVLDRTPFYAESGGQVSDTGTFTASSVKANVQELYKAPNGQHVHVVHITEGKLAVGDTVSAAVSASERQDIVKNHTATHLMHKALKEVLGGHANQAGSLVSAERLRFDFSHFGAVTPEELQEIERKVANLEQHCGRHFLEID
jgi:alanyl-tRNA synthetase